MTTEASQNDGRGNGGAAARAAGPPGTPGSPGTPGGYRILADDPLPVEGVRRHLAVSRQDGHRVTLLTAAPGGDGERDTRDLLRREAELITLTAHASPWVAGIVASDLDADAPWVACHPAAALPLREVVDADGPLPASTVAALGVALADGLAPLHGAGLGLGILSPSTVALAADGPRLTGLSAAGAERNTADDIRDLGLLLVFAATGGTTPETLPPPLGALVSRCLREEPASRPDLTQFRSALAARHQEVGAPVPLPAAVVSRLTEHAERTLHEGAPHSGGAPEEAPADVTSYELAPPRQAPPAAGPDTDGPATDGTTADSTTTDGTTTDGQGTAVPGPAGHGSAGQRGRTRRGVLAAAAAAGLLAGAGSVAGWVVGRGGGMRALTDPYPVDGDAPVVAEPPEGTAPGALWRYDGSAADTSTDPLIHDSGVAVFAGTSVVSGVDLRTGEELWSRDDLGAAQSLVADTHLVEVADGVIATVGGDQRITVFDPATGSPRWAEDRYAVASDDFYGHRVRSLHSAHEEGALLLVVTDGDGSGETQGLAGYDVAERAERWHLVLRGTAGQTQFRIVGDMVVVLSMLTGEFQVNVHRVADGELESERTFPDFPDFDTFSVHAARRWILTLLGNELRAHDLDSGEELWAHRLGADDVLPRMHRSVLVDQEDGGTREILLLTHEDRTVFGFDLDDPGELWRTEVRPVAARETEPDVPHLHASASGSTLLVGLTSEILAFDTLTGAPRWRFGFTSPAPTGAVWQTLPAEDLSVAWNGWVALGLPVR
jgi:eukaryotic-like serine/threonine-protein kinase